MVWRAHNHACECQSVCILMSVLNKHCERTTPQVAGAARQQEGQLN
jgi:hypothetical protein